jgi:hypothetical protein
MTRCVPYSRHAYLRPALVCNAIVSAAPTSAMAVWLCRGVRSCGVEPKSSTMRGDRFTNVAAPLDAHPATSSGAAPSAAARRPQMYTAIMATQARGPTSR